MEIQTIAIEDMVYGLYRYSLARCDREVTSDFAFVRQADNDPINRVVEAITSFPKEEQYQKLHASVKLLFQNFLPYWGDFFSEQDLKQTRSVGMRMDHTLHSMSHLHVTRTSEKKQVKETMRQLLRNGPGYQERKFPARSRFLAQFLTEGLCVDVCADFPRLGGLAISYIVYPIGYVLEGYIDGIVSANSPDYYWHVWSPFHTLGLMNSTQFFFNTEESLLRACQTLCEETCHFVRDIEAYVSLRGKKCDCFHNLAHYDSCDA